MLANMHDVTLSYSAAAAADVAEAMRRAYAQTAEASHVPNRRNLCILL